MQKHIKIYFDFFGYDYDPDQYHKCEIPYCRDRINDIHHIECRGMGGSKNKDYIENLMGLCRKHHFEFGDKKQYIDY